MMSDKQERQRAVWKNMAPELRNALAEIAFSTAGNSLTPEVKDNLQNQSLQDLTDEKKEK